MEKGRFVRRSAKDGKIALTAAQLAMRLEGEEDQKTIRGIVFPTQDYATQWLWTYNNDRPNMSIGGITPAQKLKMAA